ncbi:hypothetical protein [Mycolicibacterium aromaticivorans]|uniref:hypothetical protein n=1 Tax=Mycolicibacterium aromaticivorans TaxID=318425 RepID=UPI000D6D4FC3
MPDLASTYCDDCTAHRQGRDRKSKQPGHVLERLGCCIGRDDKTDDEPDDGSHNECCAGVCHSGDCIQCLLRSSPRSTAIV